ncbi:MAG: hypothetical protein FWE29_06345 [Defluviitaleaceae bacterium]|nr:hypothetical protein [Defluviitaleaceae bacterium]
MLGAALTFEDIIFAAMWAFIITTLIRGISRLIKAGKPSAKLAYSPSEISDVLKRCYAMFPKDIFIFKGLTVKRGMSIRVTTFKKSVFEGKLVGLSKDDIVICVVTHDHVIAQGLDEVEEISIIEQV